MIAEPFAFEEYRKKKIQEKIDEERENRVRIKVRCVLYDYVIV
jgi:ribosome biogenesis protein ENP2